MSIYPLGSEWYHPGQDDICVVVAHFTPRGIICLQKGPSTPEEPSYTRFGYGDLVTNCLIVPRMGGWYHEYRNIREKEEYAYQKLIDTLPNGKMWV